METLAERIARDGPVSELDAIGWAIRLAKRLEALHALGVAHGSVSPACVIAAGQDRNARAYLADVQHTTPSPAYQSPERILGGDISAADDVWALAATLYALLTGQPPFPGNNEAEVRQKILAATPPPLAVYDVGDDDLQHILDHAFARGIGRRNAGITALRRALEEWHPDRGVANLPPLEDEDSTNDDDDGARTMLVRDAGGFLQALGPGVPKLNQDDDDDDDNVRTMMRSMPRDDLAAIIARASAAADARQVGGAPQPPGPLPAQGAPAFPAPQAPRPGPQPAPFPRPGAPGPPRPAAGPPRPAAAAHAPSPMGAMAVAPAPVTPRAQPVAQAAAPQGLPAPFGGRPAPIPQLDDDDSEDEDIRTVMRTPEQMIHEEESHDAPRTVLLRDDDPWAPSRAVPAAGMPAPGAAAPAPHAAPWADGPAPAPTVALPAYYEPASPAANLGSSGISGGGGPPEPLLAHMQGTQKIPSTGGLFASGINTGPAFPQPHHQGPAAPPPGQQVLSGLVPLTAPAQPPAQQVLGSAPLAHQPMGDASSSKKGLILAALIALLIAAAATFAFLKLKGL